MTGTLRKIREALEPAKWQFSLWRFCVRNDLKLMRLVETLMYQA